MRTIITILLSLALNVAAPAQMLQSISNSKAAASSASWTFVQLGQGWASGAHLQADCAGGGAACTVPLSSTGSGHLLAIVGYAGTNVTISSINAGGTFVHCSNCQQFQALTGTIDAGWVLSSSSGVTSIIVTFSGNHAGAHVAIYEASCSGGTIAKDSNAAGTGSGTNASASSPYTGQALTLSGTQDFIVAAGVSDLDVTAAASPYNTNFNSVNGAGISYILNSTSGTAASWTAAGATKATFAALGFQCQ